MPIAAADGDAFRDQLERCRDAGLSPRFWWRDDDLVAPSEGLARMSGLARQQGATCLVAAIPALCEEALSDRLDRLDGLVFAQHGYRHENHEADGAPKNEFGPSRAPDLVYREVGDGWRRLGEIFGQRLLPVFVGPWNRCAPAFGPMLVELGFAGWSGFASEPVRPSHPKLRKVDTHIDVVRWGEHPELDSPDAIMNRIVGHLEDAWKGALWLRERLGPDRPTPQMLNDRLELIGLLTHHRVLPEKAWRSLAEVMELIDGAWVHPADLFGCPGTFRTQQAQERLPELAYGI